MDGRRRSGRGAWRFTGFSREHDGVPAQLGLTFYKFKICVLLAKEVVYGLHLWVIDFSHTHIVGRYFVRYFSVEKKSVFDPRNFLRGRSFGIWAKFFKLSLFNCEYFDNLQLCSGLR